jgi:membrane protease YdiL (CAAX protease family)
VKHVAFTSESSDPDGRIAGQSTKDLRESMFTSEHPAPPADAFQADYAVEPVPLERSTFGAKRAIWIVFCYLTVQFVFVLVSAIAVTIALMVESHGGHAPKLSAGVLMALGSLGALAGTAAGYRMARGSFAAGPIGEFERTLGLRAISSRQLALAAACGVLVSAFNVFVLIRWFPPSATQDLGPLVAATAEGGWARHVCVVFAICIAPPAEEFMIRGVLFSGLSRVLNVIPAACIATVVFALLHVSSASPYWPALIAVLLLGAAAQAARVLSGSLLPGIAMHVAYNATLVLPMYLQS